MATIPLEQRQALFTQDFIALYKEKTPPLNFLQGFFPIVERNTRYIKYAIQRFGEPVAIDLIRGSEANLNTFSIRDNKFVDPPYYAESFNATESDIYDTMIASMMDNVPATADFMEECLEKMDLLRYKIERAKEKQCAGVLKDGKVVLINGDTIDYKRKATMVDDIGAGNYWDTHADTADPYADIDNYCGLLRSIGKAQGGNFNMLCGQLTWPALIRTDIFKERAKWLNTKLDDIRPMLRNTVGANYHGRLDCGNYTVDVWTYTEGYEATPNDSSTYTPYLDPKRIVLLPDNPGFIMAHALVPQLPPVSIAGVQGIDAKAKKGGYVITDFVDRKKKTWEIEIGTCPIAIPVKVDQAATVKVVS